MSLSAHSMPILNLKYLFHAALNAFCHRAPTLGTYDFHFNNYPDFTPSQDISGALNQVMTKFSKVHAGSHQVFAPKL